MPRITTVFDGETTGIEAATKRAQDSVARYNRAIENTFEGERRVERQFDSLTRGMTQARTGFDAMTIAADRLENMFQSSLGIGMAVAAAVAIGTAFKRDAEAAEALEKKLQSALSFDSVTAGALGNLGAIQGKLAELDKLAEEVNAAQDKKSIFTKGAEAMALTVAASLGTSDWQLHYQAFGEQENALVRIQTKRRELQDAMTPAAERQLAIISSQAAGHEQAARLMEIQARYAAEIAKAQEAGAFQAAAILASTRDIAVLQEKIRNAGQTSQAVGRLQDAEAKLGLVGTDSARKLGEIDIDVARKRKERDSELAAGNPLEAQAKDVEIGGLLQNKKQLQLDQARKLAALNMELANIQDTEGGTLDRQERALIRKRDALKAELTERIRSGDFDENTVATIRNEQAKVDAQLADITKSRFEQLADIDAEERKAGLTSKGKDRQREEMQIDLERLRERQLSASDPMEARRLGVDIKRKENALASLDESEGDDFLEGRTVASGKGRLGLGGKAFSTNTLERIGERQARILEQIHDALTGGRGRRQTVLTE